MSPPDQDCFFFSDRDGNQLYGRVRLPDQGTRSTGVVIASPIGRERLRVYRELVWTSRVLATAGYPVLQFDYRGEGESEGTFDRSTLTSRVDDLEAAARELRTRSGCSDLCVMGVREGALIALLGAQRLTPTRLILCEPICDPRSHAHKLIRAHLVLQKHHYGNEAITSKDVRRTLADGGRVSIYGFFLAAPLLHELESLDPGPLLRRYDGQSALIYFAPKHVPPKKEIQRWRDQLATGGACEAICAVLNFSWTTKKIWSSHLVALNDTVTEWLQRTGQATT